MEKETQKCVLCKKQFVGYGNNPEPLAKGRCCDTCNATLVIPYRFLYGRTQQIIRNK